MTDWQLLRDYADNRSQTAFAMLVERHMNLVYRTCLRNIGDSTLAEDASQAVFLLLAQKAGVLKPAGSLVGWLFNACGLVSRNVCRTENRRIKYEKEASMAMERYGPECVNKELDYCLNEALSKLSENDRKIILLRFFEDLSCQEIAQHFGTTENTAVKRMQRAVERLRRSLSSSGKAISSTVLMAFLIDQGVCIAPKSIRENTLLAVQHISPDISKSHTSYAHLHMLNKGIYFIMQATKVKVLIGSLILALTFLAYLGYQKHRSAEISGQEKYVSWTSDSVSDLNTQNAQASIHAQYELYMEAWNSGNISAILSGLSPTYIETNGRSSNELTYDGIAKALPIGLARRPSDLLTTSVIKSCKVSGSTALLQIEETQHRTTDKNFVGGVADATVTMVNTNGKWLISKWQQ